MTSSTVHPRGTPAPTWRPCQHAPTAWVTEAAGRVRIRTAAGVVREVVEEGATWCSICSDAEFAVLRWLEHGPATSWTIATDLGWHPKAVDRAVRALRERGLVVGLPWGDGRGAMVWALGVVA